MQIREIFTAGNNTQKCTIFNYLIILICCVRILSRKILFLSFTPWCFFLIKKISRFGRSRPNEQTCYEFYTVSKTNCHYSIYPDLQQAYEVSLNFIAGIHHFAFNLPVSILIGFICRLSLKKIIHTRMTNKIALKTA